MARRDWTIWGVAELGGWVLHRRHYWPTGHDAEDCIDAHLACNVSHIVLDLGRSVLTYHSDLPGATCYGLGRHYELHYPTLSAQEKAFMDASRERCQLRAALTYAESQGVMIYGRLCMNRHYSPGGQGRSDFAQNHPEWSEVGRDGWLDATRMCFAIPEYRQERVAILKEAAEIGCEGLVLDFVRQPPAVKYHAAFVNPWRDRTGVDPRTVPVSDKDRFLDWCAFRAESVTALLGELKAALDPMRQKHGRTIPVRVRIPNDGFEANLIAGLDVRAWCRQGLVDEISLSELHWLPGYSDWDDRPYIALGKEHGIPVFASSNCLPVQRSGWSGQVNPLGVNPLVLARRALASMEAGAQGVSLYQTDVGTYWPGLKDAIAAFSDEDVLRRYVTDPSIIERHPVTEANREYGIDNHSAAQETLEAIAADPDGYRV